MASRRSEIRAERKALKEKEALQNASSGLKHKFTVVDALMYAFIAILSLICLYPFVNVIAYSLSGADAVLANDVTFYPKDFTLAAYKNIAARPTIWISLRVTIIITIAGTALGLVLTTAAAYALSRPNLPGRKVLSGLILFTMYFSGGIIPTFLVVKSLGMYDTLTALVIPNAMNVFNFVIMRTFFRQLPRELDEAAQRCRYCFVLCFRFQFQFWQQSACFTQYNIGMIIFSHCCISLIRINSHFSLDCAHCYRLN